MNKLIGLAAACGTLSGCAYLTRPIENPIIEQHAQNRINTFAVIPSRRMMIVKSEPGANSEEKLMLVCAEASADVTDNLASTLAASLAVSGPSAGDKKAADASAAVSSTMNTYARFLFKRTQGIQLYRDRSYHLCQARMNGFITNEQYFESMNAAFKDVIPLIKEELPMLKDTMPSNDATPPAAVTPPAAAASAGATRASAGNR